MGAKPLTPRQPKKPLPKAVYFAGIAALSLVVSGALAFFAIQPQWKTGFAYQYLPEHEQSLSSDKAVPGSINPINAHMAILGSDKFVDELEIYLAGQGFSGWSSEKIAQAIKISHPDHSNLIHVDVITGQKEVSQAIAQELNRSYLAYVKQMQKDSLLAEKAFTESSLNNIKARLTDGETSLQETLATMPQLQGSAFVNNPAWGEKTLTDNYLDLSRKIEDLESQMAVENTRYTHYKALLNKDEKSLMEGVILGEDPVVNRIEDQLATAETDATIQAVKLGPEDANIRVKSLQNLLNIQRQKLLGGGANGKPVIRDSLRKGFIEELMASKVQLQAAQTLYNSLIQQREGILKHLNSLALNMGDYNAWMLQKSLLQNARAAMEKQLDDVDYRLKHLTLPVKIFRPLPQNPVQIRDWNQSAGLFLSSFSGLFLLLSAVPLVMHYRSGQIPNRSIFGILQDLMHHKGQQIIMMMPVSSSGHLNASTHLGGLLNQFGRDSLVIDVDLCHRLLSRKIPLEHPYGMFEHMLNADMKKPYADPLSGAKMIPLEATLEADKVVEFSQVIQRIPRLWERWPASVIILDLSQWHETYHQLLPHVSQVVFYVPPAHKSSLLLPKVFKDKYHVPVSLVEIQPEN